MVLSLQTKRTPRRRLQSQTLPVPNTNGPCPPPGRPRSAVDPAWQCKACRGRPAASGDRDLGASWFTHLAKRGVRGLKTEVETPVLCD